MPQHNPPTKLSAFSVEPAVGTTAYPPEYRDVCEGRIKRRLGDHFGLSQFGVNMTVLEPGAGSAQRHWHSHEDEFVYVLNGTLTLIDDSGETLLEAGDCAGFPAGRANGHMIVNRSDAQASYLEIGSRHPDDTGNYPDVDMHARKIDGKYRFFRKDGTPTD